MYSLKFEFDRFTRILKEAYNSVRISQVFIGVVTEQAIKFIIL